MSQPNEFSDSELMAMRIAIKTILSVLDKNGYSAYAALDREAVRLSNENDELSMGTAAQIRKLLE